jgi:tetratricopeptide (TPR) repeat protein
MTAKRAKSAPIPQSTSVSWIGWSIGLLVVASFAAYANSWNGAWVFDDHAAIVNNPSLRSWSMALFPPGGGITVTGRPVLNASLAISYALSGPEPWGHHILNWLIHTAAGLALFGTVRRSLAMPRVPASWREQATPVAMLVALLWLVHPLQTESVTYIVQRAESLMGLWLLLTFYAYVRSVTAVRVAAWQAVSVAACLLGVGTKEVIVTVPVLVLLHDRALVAGSFLAAWRQRRWLYVGLFATWIPLAALVLAGGGNRGGSVGFGSEADALSYWLTQFEAVGQYLRLSFWPQPLIFEYGTFWKSGFTLYMVCVVIVTGLVLGTGWALVRRPALGFLGAWFFILLAPTSVMPGTTQMIVEHRMYLPLAGVLMLTVLGLWTWLGRWALGAGAVAALILTGLTLQRNKDYHDEVTLWADTLAKRPNNATAHDSFAVALARKGDESEALTHLAEAARLAPTRADYLTNYGTALLRAGQTAEAVVQFQRALQLAPHYGLLHLNLGLALQRLGRTPEALTHLEEGVRAQPEMVEALSSLAALLVNLGRVSEALPHLEKAVRLAPGYAPPRVNLGVALVLSQRPTEAVVQLKEALRLDGSMPEAHNAMGLALIDLGRPAEAAGFFETAVQMRPQFQSARDNLEKIRATMAAPR